MRTGGERRRAAGNLCSLRGLRAEEGGEEGEIVRGDQRLESMRLDDVQEYDDDGDDHGSCPERREKEVARP